VTPISEQPAKERFLHRRGTRTGDGKQFGTLNPQDRQTIKLRLPEDTEISDTIEGQLYKALHAQNDLPETIQQLLSTDGMFQEDRFRVQLAQAIQEGNLKVVQPLATLILLNTMRLQLIRNEGNFKAIQDVDAELAIELSDPQSSLLIVQERMLAGTEVGKLFRQLVKSGQALPYKQIRVEGTRYSIYKVSSLV